MAKATDAAMEALHGALAKTLKDHIENPGTDENGIPLPPNASILSVARQFLKDNHIEVGAGSKPGALHGLAGLPVFEDENVVPIKKAN